MKARTVALLLFPIPVCSSGGAGRRGLFPGYIPHRAGTGRRGEDEAEGQFNWNAALVQPAFFMTTPHSFGIAAKTETRANLSRPFWRDYFRSIRGFSRWDDGDPFIVNYIGHLTMGGVTGYTYVENQPRYANPEFGARRYWKSRFKALAFSAAYSTYFEIGPLCSPTPASAKGRRRRSISW